MCAELTANVNVYVDGYVGQTVSVVLHQEGCEHLDDPAEVTVHPDDGHSHTM